MLKALATAFTLIGLVLIGATLAEIFLPPPPVAPECFAFIGRDDDADRVFLLNKCDGSVRVLVMPSAHDSTIQPNYNKPHI